MGVNWVIVMSRPIGVVFSHHSRADMLGTDVELITDCQKGDRAVFTDYVNTPP